MVCNMHFKYLKMHFIKTGWENYISTYKRMDLDPYLKTWSGSKDPNVRATTVTFLEENRRKASFKASVQLWIWQWFFGYDTESIGKNNNRNKLDFIKIKNFCEPKGTIKKVKRQLMEWEKIFTSYIYDKQLIFRIYNELLQQQK